MKFHSEIMNLNINSAVAYLTFKRLEEYSFVNHAFSTRLGGVSKGYFKSMNLSFNRGDEEKNVKENYRLFCDAAGFDINSLVIPNLTHGKNIEKAESFKYGIGLSETVIDQQKDVIMKELLKKFRPEFINRLEEVIYFNSLSDSNLKDIIKLPKIIPAILTSWYSRIERS